MSRRVLVAGVGNIFLGDDGFGVEVAKRLAEDSASLPDDVVVGDYGIRGIHLAYELLRGYDTLILIDAASAGADDPPGTVFVLEPDFTRPAQLERRESGFLIDAHAMDPELLLGIVSDLGGRPPRVRIVGCQPADTEERMGLSPAVAPAVDVAVGVLRDLLDREMADASACRDSNPSQEV